MTVEESSAFLREYCRTRIACTASECGKNKMDATFEGMPLIDLDNINQNVTVYTRDHKSIDNSNSHRFYLSIENPGGKEAAERMRSPYLNLSPNSPATKLFIDEVPLPISFDILNTDSRKTFSEL